MTHTPKPWETGHFGELQEDDELEFGRIYGPGEDVIICDVYDENNMNLIAAAAELLEACDRMRDALEQTIALLNHIDTGDFLDDLQFGIQVIAKAKGI